MLYFEDDTRCIMKAAHNSAVIKAVGTFVFPRGCVTVHRILEIHFEVDVSLALKPVLCIDKLSSQWRSLSMAILLNVLADRPVNLRVR